jgi:glucuronokinase
MLIIRKKAYARAGFLGNPSDGYNGKTISFIVKNFAAEVVLYEWNTTEIVLSDQDRAKFRSVHDLANDVRMHGYYGGIRLVKATIKRFVEYCDERNIELHKQNFSVRYNSNIPRQVGLAGSSSIIVATLRSLMEFYDVQIPVEVQPSFVLSVERDELGITGGLQDRVIQIYEGIVYMNFDKACEKVIDGYTCYEYERLNEEIMPEIYVAYHDGLSEPTEIFHNDIRGRFLRGEPDVVNAMHRFAEIAAEGKNALESGDIERVSELIDENFDLRRSISRLPGWQVEMVETARKAGASAKFAGSGGAIVGTFRGAEMFNQLKRNLASISVKTIIPDYTTGKIVKIES